MVRYPIRAFRRLSCILLIFLLLSLLVVASRLSEKSMAKMLNTQAADPTYFVVRGPCGFEFPRDHGSHPGYRIEWWYYTGNLRSQSGERFGFQLTFFRTQLGPPGSEMTWPKNPSGWRTQQVFLAHAAVSDLSEGNFWYDEKIARGAVGLAGATQKESTIRVFLGTWSARLGPEAHRLNANGNEFSLDLRCRPVKPPVAHGLEGYSRKGENPQDASCYYSFTHLKTSGKLMIQGKPFSVQGTAWMDHEFSTEPLDEAVVGWDWFSIQLENKSQLMIYLLRRREGGYSSASSGTYIPSSGGPLHLSFEDFQVKILDKWESRKSGAIYPSRWQIQVYPVDLELLATSNLPDQELRTRTTRIIYWEGSVSLSGKVGGHATQGVGYVEMTGYAKPFGLFQ